MKIVALLLILSANVCAQSFPCNCGLHDTFVLHPGFVPEEGVPFSLSISRVEEEKFILRLEPRRTFLEELVLQGYSLRISDRDLPLVSEGDSRPYFGWCMSAQRGVEKVAIDLTEKADELDLSLTVELSPDGVSRGFLIVAYESEMKTKTYWIPLGLQPKKPANQPVQHNAGSRPVSDDSPASETPSALAPRG